MSSGVRKKHIKVQKRSHKPASVIKDTGIGLSCVRKAVAGEKKY